MIRSGNNFLLLWCLGLGMTACNTDISKPGSSTVQKATSQTEAPSRTTRSEKHIVFFGNSLTAGYGLEESQAFPALLQRRLDSLKLPYVAVNAGLSGETSAGGLNRIDWVLNQPMDVFVLELGANDALRGFDLETTQKNLLGIIEKVRAKHPGMPIVLAGMKAPPNMGGEYASRFSGIYTTLSQSEEVDLIPFLLEGVAGKPDLNLPDGIHPNAMGQKLVLENVWSVLNKHLDEAG